MDQFKVESDGIYQDVPTHGAGIMRLVMSKDAFKQAYEKYICGGKVTELEGMSLSKLQVDAFDVQYKKLEEEFEETIRGELMNLRSVKKHLFAFLTPDSITDPDLAMAYKIVKDDVESLEKFVMERWGE